MRYYVRTIQQIGSAVRSARKSAGLTQKEAAEKVGMLPKTISLIENASPNSTIESLMKVLAAVDCTIEIVPKDEQQKRNGQQWDSNW